VNLKPVQYCQAQVAAVSVHAFAGLSAGLTCQSRMGVVNQQGAIFKGSLDLSIRRAMGESTVQRAGDSPLQDRCVQLQPVLA